MDGFRVELHLYLLLLKQCMKMAKGHSVRHKETELILRTLSQREILSDTRNIDFSLENFWLLVFFFKLKFLQNNFS